LPRVRRIVVIMVLHGLLPGFGAVATASGLRDRGEPIATAMSAPGDAHSNPEHGCGVTLHLCSCCVSQAVLLPAVSPALRELAPVPSEALGVEQPLAHREQDRPFRPPIR
jgi:hypothetical protein